MCGICGQFNYSTNAPADGQVIGRMMNSISHRGPDDSGQHLDGSLGLGFRRLAIIDLSPAGHQPMSDQAESVWVVFNGEIYNFQELRRELEGHGHVFRSNCDTEVVVHGYKQWGDAVLNRFNGMFGLAIWDVKKRRLVLARDQMGMKCVYYTLKNGTLTFGSEIRPIRAALSESTAIDIESVALFLRYRYTPAPRTMFGGIQKLAAGEKLVVENGHVEVSRYYNYAPTPFHPQPKVEEEAEKLLEIYNAALKRHLISDVPLGLLLSGGMDSGLLLGLMSQHGEKWPTFTVGYGSSFSDDELNEAAETARIYGAEHHPINVTRTAFENVLPGIVNVLEEPVASSSIVPMYFVCQRARENVKVALIGQGPDELFGGYNRHLGVHYGNWWRWLPTGLQSVVGFAVNRLSRNETLKRGVSSLGTESRLKRYQDVFSLAPESTIHELFREGLLPELGSDGLVEYWRALLPQMKYTDELGGFQLLEIRSSLPDELLMYADKLSMTHSLELRVPYLDRTVVEYVQRLGAGFKVHNASRKWLHRQICANYLPSRILKRKKRGFAVNVVDAWFRSSLEDELSDTLLDKNSLMFSLLEPEHVGSLLRAHRSGRHDHHKLLFSLVMFEHWLRGIRRSNGDVRTTVLRNVSDQA